MTEHLTDQTVKKLELQANDPSSSPPEADTTGREVLIFKL
jgi:hypothetical protein